MIWVIGDIHGMFDPLKRLISMIQARYKEDDSDIRSDKLIFIGDYIDYGPSSKEVIDYIMNLPFETVFLMGNHEDMLLQFVNNSELFQRFGNVWFRGAGGQRTVHSFFPDKFYRDSDEDKMPREEFALDPVYLDFFRNLKVSHTETIGNKNFTFMHALPNKKFSLEEQLAIKTYDDFHRWRKENNLWIEETLLWNREEPKTRFGDHIIVHGHTPTSKLDQAWDNLHGYDPKSKFPFFKFEEESEGEVSFYDDSYSERQEYTGDLDNLISINVDTGAIYGDSLTAIGLSEELLYEGTVEVYRVSTGVGYRFMQDDFHYSEVRMRHDNRD